MLKLVAFDLDGTLLTSEGEISPHTKEELLDFIQQDMLIVPCSARSYQMIPEWFKGKKGIPYLVCQNGAKVYDNTTHEPIEVNQLSSEKVREICTKLKNLNENFSFNIGETIVSTTALYEFLRDQDTQFKYEMFRTHNRFYKYDYLSFLNTIATVDKLHICVGTAEEKAKLYEEAKKIEGISVVSSHPNNVEITHERATKGCGLSLVMKRYDIQPAEVAAFGDYDNDLSLLQTAGYGTAMKNGSKTLQMEAKYITDDDNNHDGVVRFVRKLLQKEQTV